MVSILIALDKLLEAEGLAVLLKVPVVSILIALDKLLEEAHGVEHPVVGVPVSILIALDKLLEECRKF